MTSYIPSTQQEQQQMLAEIGMQDFADLFRQIPDELKVHELDALPQGMDEMTLKREMRNIASKNKIYNQIYRGAGAYWHYIPSVVNVIGSRQEFVSAYTPYQAELSQGLLQLIFEYQTMICELTGMDASNASVYDGATAAAEACKMAGNGAVYVAETVNPQTVQVIRTYLRPSGRQVNMIPSTHGVTDVAALQNLPRGAGVLIQQPNYYGLFEDAEAIGAAAHAAGGKFIISSNPTSLAIAKSPREYGADIAVGDAQPFGMPLSFGGPYAGFMACDKKIMRNLPGRIVGETTDKSGKRAFVLTLQAREQHIKREKSGSSICTNQALCALRALAYASAMGPDGLREVATLCMSKARYAAAEICKIDAFELKYPGDFFHEFVTVSKIDTRIIQDELSKRGILSGLPLDSAHMLWCCTEMNTKSDIDLLCSELRRIADVCEYQGGGQ